MNRISQQAWSVSLDSLLLPVRIEHEKFDYDERIDDLPSRLDYLALSTSLTYAHTGPVPRRGFDGLWGFSEFFSRLPIHEVRTTKGPLEEMIDEILDLMLETASTQQVEPWRARVQARREGIAVGAPVLSGQRVFKDHPAQPDTEPGILRSAGIDSTPLQVVVDHSWCTPNLRVEHKDRRAESLEVSFHAVSRAQKVSSQTLEGSTTTQAC